MTDDLLLKSSHLLLLSWLQFQPEHTQARIELAEPSPSEGLLTVIFTCPTVEQFFIRSNEITLSESNESSYGLVVNWTPKNSSIFVPRQLLEQNQNSASVIKLVCRGDVIVTSRAADWTSQNWAITCHLTLNCCQSLHLPLKRHLLCDLSVNSSVK